ncbi:MAG: thioredoxin domain-containing protein [Candidatus Hodarchaeota archaeon]
MTKKPKTQRMNRLAQEKSPYLLQHANNPVDWYPWTEEAFKKAKKENKPIFLSIGYSTCHWCHVMAHESFENPKIAALMNEAFVNIKVDREERPDIDALYMSVAQMMTGSGGWPLTIIMTPNKQPFFAATYIPSESRFGRIGMLELIPELTRLWNEEHPRLDTITENIQRSLEASALGSQGAELAEGVLELTFDSLSERFDSKYGGFGFRPKFPSPHNLLFLLRYWKRTGNDEALQMVETTLQALRHGGIFDHIGLGFHRYSTDPQWLLPHFEKMLYDQAMLTLAYTEAYQATKNPNYAQTVHEILTYVLREMTSPDGGFYSAEDADSEGEEGKFYVWTQEEIRKILSPHEADLFVDIYNFEPTGNYLEEASGKRTGTNIPHLQRSLVDEAKSQKLTVKTLKGQLEIVRQKLFEAREKRIHPYKDDKILADWNGLMIAGLAKAARIIGEPMYTKAAVKAAKFVLEYLQDSKGRLLHRFRDGEAAIPAFLDDYAFMIWGLLELYEATFDIKYLQKAIELNTMLLTHFWDKENGGFFFTADYAEKLLVRKKDAYDGAIPSGNSVAMLNLLRLAHLTGDSDLEAKAAKVGQAFSSDVLSAPSGFTLMSCSVDFAVGPSYEIVVAGDPAESDTQKMIQTLHDQFIPNKVILLIPTDEQAKVITQLAPFTKDYRVIDGKATAYVCAKQVCQSPTTKIKTMLEYLS